MPRIKDAIKPPANMDSLFPVESTPAPPTPPDSNSQPGWSSGSIAPIPSLIGTTPDSQRQWFRPGVSQFRIMPLPSKANPTTNAATRTTARQLVEPVGALAAQAAAAAAALQATSFQGAWSSSETYNQGASVDSGGTIYVSLLNNNIGNNPASSPTEWVATGGANTSVFEGAWSSATAYVIGNQVIDVAGGGGYYIALTNSTNKQPSAHPTNWQLITAGNLNSYEGNYSGSTGYVVGDLVSFNGALWVAVAGSTGQTPSLTSSFWSLLGSNSLFTGPWSSSTPYPQNSFVSENGNVYQALTANTNVDPATHPGTWQLSGPATLDNLVDGSAFQKVLASMVNLVPDSDLTAPTVYWPGASGALIQYETRYPSAPGCPAFFLPGTGSPSGFNYVYSRPMAVIPGQTYTLSGHINALSVTSGTPTWSIFDPTISTNYANASQTAGVDGRVSVTFTVPGGVTQVVCLLDSNNCTITNGQNLFWFQPQLVTGSNAGAYISSSADYLSGTVLINFGSTNHTNKNLNSIPDGTSTFGQTASGLSYRPLSNPLTGHDAGSSATINVASFTMRTSSKGDISENSGSITGLSYATGYYVYEDDPTLAGGAVTYHAATTKGTALQGAGRFYVGSITTPASGAIDTIGNNDGGGGAQNGGTLVILSTAQAGTYGSVTPTSAASPVSNAGSATETWSGYVPQNPASPSVIQIQVTSSVVIIGTGVGNSILQYSTNGGSSFTTVYNTSVNRALTTDIVNVTLPANVTSIQIQALNSHTAGTGTCTHTLSNIAVIVQI
jgi:hypothetical protein